MEQRNDNFASVAIKDGDIITLANGSKATVSLTPVKEEPKINTWYICRRTNQLIFRTDDLNGYYGVIDGQWVSSGLDCSGKSSAWDLATQQEITEALKAEAIKRGFVKGVKTQGMEPNKYDEVSTLTGGFELVDGVLKANCTGEFFIKRNIFENGNWAVIQKSVLDQPNIAIKVNNKREAYILITHMASRGWTWISGDDPHSYDNYSVNNLITYKDKFSNYLVGNEDIFKGTIISFEEFAKEIGIEVPKFIMKSHDGVDLYEGDNYYEASITCGKWMFIYDPRHFKLNHNCRPVKYPENNKAFADEAKCKEYIEEQNKPKEIYLTGGAVYLNISNNQVTFRIKSNPDENHSIKWLNKEDIKIISKALSEKD